MKDIIVFIPKDIDVAIRKEITDVLHENHITIVDIKEQANLILEKEPIESDIKKFLEDSKAKLVLSLKQPELKESVLLKTKRQKKFIKTTVNLTRFNKAHQFYKQRTLNKIRNR